MPIHEKAMETKLLAGASVVATLLVVVGILVIGCVIYIYVYISMSRQIRGPNHSDT